jgi:hypothetical protein
MKYMCNLPASSRTFTALKYSDEVKCLFLSEGINGDGTRWTGADDGYTLHTRDRH